ncbi:MAG: D-glycero-beta-D-manno-heptose 1-phosphate adenylyltransferase [Candidatus Sericytochromatia bacterium]|nr:D-glycero-beta-D-manno-heptose 1-phosphate adenylyltransferase [Candidatus Sericytochromatia bacterium]
MIAPDLDAAGQQVAAWQAAGETVVFTNGCFDILHAGHVRYLNAARALGQRLVVGLNSDDSVRGLKGPGRPINAEADRAEVLDGLRAVDMVVLFATPTATPVIEALRPQIYAKGGDYRPETLPEAPAVHAVGGRIALLPFLEGRSTTGIVQRLASPTTSVPAPTE